MKFHYKLSNVLGSIYNNGNILFTPSGNDLLSPIGNKILNYDLKNNRSTAFDFESDYNFNNLALSPNGHLLLASSEKNHLYMCSLISGIILNRKEYKNALKITNIKFSDCGRFYLITLDNTALIYRTPGFALNKLEKREISPFKIFQVFKGCYDDIICCDWSSKSKLICVGSCDFTVQLFNIYTLDKISISGHSDTVIGCFFAKTTENDIDLYTISRNGQLFIWKSSHNEDELDNLSNEKWTYKRISKYFFNTSLKTSGSYVTSVAYHSKTKLLVTGYSNGQFLLHEMPDFNLIQSLELSSTGQIDSIDINNTGDLIGLASSIKKSFNSDADFETSTESKLVVWEWQSESFIIKQTGSGCGITNVCETVTYSPDGIYLATGFSNGKIKLWHTLSGFCFATFNEHKGLITGLEFLPNKGGNVLVSSSLDGTIRAFDLKRYRNFRTLLDENLKPKFNCLSVDSVSGDFVAAGSQNTFEIFVFNITTGKLLDKLTGHTAPVSSLSFSPSSNILASCSWDGTVRLWNLFESAKIQCDLIPLSEDCVKLAFRPDGKEVCVSTTNSQLAFINTENGQLNGVQIEGKSDLGVSQNIEEEIVDKDKYFTCIAYSGDGEFVLCGGKSKYICLYNVKEKLLVKKFKMTYNLSLNGFLDYISSRKVTEFGFNLESIKMRQKDVGEIFKPIGLPGVKKGNFTDRQINPQIQALDIKFSPTMRSFVTSTTQGILVYSLDVVLSFDPFHLDASITPETIKNTVNKQEYLDGLMQALKLNNINLITLALESVPTPEIVFVVKSLPFNYVEKCLSKIALILENNRHLEFYLLWIKSLLTVHGINLKNFSSSKSLASVLRLLQRNMKNHFENLENICSTIKYKLNFLINLHEQIKNNKSKNKLTCKKSEIKLITENCSDGFQESDIEQVFIDENLDLETEDNFNEIESLYN